MRHLIVAAALCTAVPAAAQQARWSLPPSGSPVRFTVGALGLAAVPNGAFSENVGTGVQGGGFTAFGLMRLDAIGVLSLRLEGGGVWYGTEKQRVSLFSPRVGANVVTTNSIGAFGIGPELAVPVGPIRPYVNATIGVHAFSTSSALEGVRNPDGSDENFSTKNQGDATRAYGFGGGVRIPVGRRNSDFSIDLGTRYFDGGEAEYLTKGDITDNPDGTLTLNTRRSSTNFQTYYIGVSVALRPSGPKRY